jgi:hypothetical protein
MVDLEDAGKSNSASTAFELRPNFFLGEGQCPTDDGGDIVAHRGNEGPNNDTGAFREERHLVTAESERIHKF